MEGRGGDQAMVGEHAIVGGSNGEEDGNGGEKAIVGMRQ